MKQRKVCPKGHVFYKTSDCPTCPRCEVARKPKDGFLAELAAPARRALEGAGLTTLAKLARKSELQLRELHGMGPNAILKLRALLRGTMAENKTKPTEVSVAAFLKETAKGQQLKDSQELVKLFKELTGKPAKMWGPSIVGFDSYHYVYESGREGDAPLIGFSPRKPDLVLYLDGLDDESLVARLGKCRVSKACLYVKKLDDLDRDLLKVVAKASIAMGRKRYPAKAASKT